MPRSSNSWPGWAKLTTDLRSRRDSSSAVSPTTGSRSIVRRRRSGSRQAGDSLIWLRYWLNAPTVGQIHISLSLSTMSSCVPRWPMSLSASSAEPAHERRVADDDRDPLDAVAQVARQGQALGDRQAGAGVAAVEHVVGDLAAAREAAHAAELAERPEAVEPAGQELVRVGLVAGVPDDPVARRVEQPMEGDRQLDDAERGAEVAAGRGDRLDDRLADLGGQLARAGPRRGRAGRPARWRLGRMVIARSLRLGLGGRGPERARSVPRNLSGAPEHAATRRRSGSSISSASIAPPARSTSRLTRSSASASSAAQCSCRATPRSYSAIDSSSGGPPASSAATTCWSSASASSKVSVAGSAGVSAGVSGFTLVTGLLGRRRIGSLREAADPRREEHTKGDSGRHRPRSRSPTNTTRSPLTVEPADRRSPRSHRGRPGSPAGPRRRLDRVADDPPVARPPDDRVAALEGRLRPERAERGAGAHRPTARARSDAQRRSAGRSRGRAARPSPCVAAPSRARTARVARSSSSPARSRSAASWPIGLSPSSARRSAASLARRCQRPSAPRPPGADASRAATAAASSARSGTTSSAATDGVGGAHVGGELGQRHVGLVADAADDRAADGRRPPARRASSLNAQRSSSEPPPRARIVTAALVGAAGPSAALRVQRPTRPARATMLAGAPVALDLARRRGRPGRAASAGRGPCGCRARPRPSGWSRRAMTAGRTGSGRLRAASNRPSGGEPRLERLEPQREVAEARPAGARRRRAGRRPAARTRRRGRGRRPAARSAARTAMAIRSSRKIRRSGAGCARP